MRWRIIFTSEIGYLISEVGVIFQYPDVLRFRLQMLGPVPCNFLSCRKITSYRWKMWIITLKYIFLFYIRYDMKMSRWKLPNYNLFNWNMYYFISRNDIILFKLWFHFPANLGSILGTHLGSIFRIKIGTRKWPVWEFTLYFEQIYDWIRNVWVTFWYQNGSRNWPIF